jgi:acyl-coenzyme A synthetase/AMP-(fatty) acid ligase
MADHVTATLHGTSHIQAIEVPGIEEFFREEEAETITYSKTWDEGKDDPWLVYHTSGTTGMFSSTGLPRSLWISKKKKKKKN